jgi:hypothetical protein
MKDLTLPTDTLKNGALTPPTKKSAQEIKLNNQLMAAFPAAFP